MTDLTIGVAPGARADATSKELVVGIDLGTTNSLVAYMPSRTFPSTVMGWWIQTTCAERSDRTRS